MSTLDPFDRKFGNRARQLRRAPNAQAWDRLEARLDQRRRRTRLFGVRPWLVAAMLLLVAGVAALSDLGRQPSNPLAKRAEFIEELHAPYVPAEPFQPRDYDPATETSPVTDADFRDVMVAEKYRAHG